MGGHRSGRGDHGPSEALVHPLVGFPTSRKRSEKWGTRPAGF
jgi:hypothetical protein